MLRRKIPLLLLLLGVFFVGPYVTNAAVILQETDETSTYKIVDGATGGTYIYVYQTLTALTNGPIKFIEFYGGRNTSGTSKYLRFEIQSATGTPICSIGQWDTTGNNTNEFNEIPTGGSASLLTWTTDGIAGSDCDTTSLTAGTQYRIRLGYTVDGAFMDGEFFTKGTSPSTFFFRAYDEGQGPEGGSNTRVLRVVTPLLYATTTSPVTVSFDYYNGTPDNATGYKAEAWKIESLGYSQSVTWWEDLATTTAGTWNFSTTTTMLPVGTWKVTFTLTAKPPQNAGIEYWYFNQADGANEVIFGVDVSTLTNYQNVVSGPAVFQGYASTSCQINFLGTFNLSDCVGYLFLPTQNIYQTYQTIPQTFATKFPFSYAYSVAQVWQQLSYDGDENAPTLEYNLHDLGIGSTSPMGNFLPNVTVFSASTTKEYFPEGTFDLLKSLAEIAIILSFFLYMFFEIKQLIKT